MLSNILNSCKSVMEKSEYVKINYEVLEGFIRENNFNLVKHWLSDNPYGILDLDISILINFLLYFESIDYSFWGDPKWTIESKLGLKDGCDALMYSMLNYINTGGNVDFGNITFDEFTDMLRGNVEIPLLKERYETITLVSNVVKNKMDGNFYEFVKDIHSDIELLDVIVNNFECFKDERIYGKDKIYFYKLAQLLVSDILHIRERIEGISVDYSHLVGCADYKIPQIMRGLGITEYNEELSSLIDNKQEIAISSKYEVEIRASMIVVIDYIKSKVYNIKSIDINDYFFLASRLVKAKKPYHLTRNTNY